MIQKVEMYQAVCDGCGKHDEHIYKKKNEAMNMALYRDWLNIDSKLYCPDCVVWDREKKSYKPKEKIAMDAV